MAQEDHKPDTNENVQDAMTLEEIKRAGILVDLPSEGVAADPKPLEYEEGAGTEQWVPDPKWAEESGYNEYLKRQQGADSENEGETKE